MHTKKILFAAALLTVLAACSSDDQSSEPMEQLTPVTLQYTTIDATETRAAQDLNQGTFASGEPVKVLISNPSVYLLEEYDFTTGDAGAMSPASTVPYYPVGVQTINIAAYYPGSNTDLLDLRFYVATDQTTDADYKASDLMYASVTNQAKQAAAVNLAFTHKMAKLCVNVTAGTGVGSINSVSILNVKRGIKFDARDGTFGELKGDPETIAMSNNGAACIPPQTIDGGLLSITTDKGTATYTVSNKAFESGKVYTINLTVNRRAIIATTNAITGWTSEGTVTVVAERPLPHIAEHEYVDMGTVTIGGVEKNLKWATCNMGACYPWEYGDYYAWGATTPFYQYGYSEESPGTHWIDGKTGYNEASCPFYSMSTNNYTKYNSTDGKLSFADDDYADDAARQRWGVTWRIPTHEEWTALCDASLYDWVHITDYLGSGKNGMLVTRKADTGPCAGNSIFLPAAGWRNGDVLEKAGTWGYYWSSSIYTENYYRFARIVLFDFKGDVWKNGYNHRYYGQSIRPVSD